MVDRSVAPPQHQTLYVLRSECVESDERCGCDGRRKRKVSKCVYLGEVVVVQVGQPPDGQNQRKKRLVPYRCRQSGKSWKRSGRSWKRPLPFPDLDSEGSDREWHHFQGDTRGDQLYKDY